MTVIDAATGIRVLNAHGTFGAPQRVSWAGGVFALGDIPSESPFGGTFDGANLWMIPGLVDAHAHVAWHAFNEDERRAETPEQCNLATNEVLGKMLSAGFTSVRDAGGFDPSIIALDQPAPRIQASVELIGRETADAAGGVLAATERALARGSRWIKLIGTASVASPPGSGLEPHFTAAEQRAVVRRAAEVGAGVMLHAWGGSAIDDAINAGVMSIEHGIFLTPEQASRAAEAGMTLVPTLLIYRHVRHMIAAGKLPAAFAPRVDEALKAHPASVRLARDAGLAIALGTDFSTPEQHGTNRAEFDELVRAGLSRSEALIAATRAGAELMARVAVGPTPSGVIADGEIADAVVLNRNPLVPGPEGPDPHAPHPFSDPSSVVAVILGGRYIDIASSNIASTGIASAP